MSAVFRNELGIVLRSLRLQQGRTLREVAPAAGISLGFLAEIERGKKECSSEVMASIAAALNVPLALIIARVAVALHAGEAEQARHARLDASAA